MKLYDRINWKVVANAFLILLALSLVGLMLGRPLSLFGGWLSGISDYLGHAFCDPVLWLLGLDDLMWGRPEIQMGSIQAAGMGLLYILSVIAHLFAIIGIFRGIIEVAAYVNKKK